MTFPAPATYAGPSPDAPSVPPSVPPDHQRREGQAGDDPTGRPHVAQGSGNSGPTTPSPLVTRPDIWTRTIFFGHRRNRSATPQAPRSSSESQTVARPTAPHLRSKSTLLARVSKFIPCVPQPDRGDALTPQTVEMRSSATDPQAPTSDAPLHATGLPSLNVDEVGVDETQTCEDSDIVLQPSPLLLEDETDGSKSGSVTPPGSTAEFSALTLTVDFSDESEATSFADDEGDVDPFVYDEHAEEQRLIKNGGSGIPIGPDGRPRPLLPPVAPQHVGRKCLVLDLDETLIHSSFKSIAQPDFILPVEIDWQWHRFHVLKRPGVETFLKEMGEIYEYANLVLDKLDLDQSVAHRLFRQDCFLHKGAYVKDLSQLGRPLADTIILDNSPVSFLFHPHNAVPGLGLVSSWFNDPHDVELTDLIPFLWDLASVPDVRGILNGAI
ncbi:HAD-like domain-containing protein [Mycena haematopus]|nr:HAD-like domain-containing protein [Mycena haematopus]